MLRGNPFHRDYNDTLIRAVLLYKIEAAAKQAWRSRVGRLFEEAPIPFRPQNGGDYPDGHVLATHVAADQSGLVAHIAGREEKVWLPVVQKPFLIS